MQNIIKFINKNFTLLDIVVAIVIFALVYYLLSQAPEQFAHMFYSEEKDPRQKTNKSILEYIYTSPKSVF
jgi:hypothetical protein